MEKRQSEDQNCRIKLLLLLWMHSMVACRPICPLAGNFVEYGPNGKIVDCIPCPECAEEYGLSIPCGSTITNESIIECVPCITNKTYSDSHGIGSCRPCQYCGRRNIVQPCSKSQNRECGEKCPKGYFFDHNIKDCVEVKTYVTATVKSTESTPAVHKDHNPNITTKKRLTPEASLIKSSSSQPQLSSEVAGITPTASITIIIILAAAVVVLVLLLIIILVCKKWRESPRTDQDQVESTEDTELTPLQSGAGSANTSRNSSCLLPDPESTPLHSQGETENHVTETSSPSCIGQLGALMNDVHPGEVSDSNPPEIPTDISTTEAVDEPDLTKIPEDCLVSAMEELRNGNGGTMLLYVQKKLDAVEKPTNKTWRSVGRCLEVYTDDLNLIEAECTNGKSTTEVLLSKLKTFQKEPTMREFVQAVINCERYDVANYICNWPWEEFIAKGEGKDLSVMGQSQPGQDKR